LDASGLTITPGPSRTEFLSTSIVTPRDGKLLVHAELGKPSGTCPAGATYAYCNALFGLFLDGEAVPGSYRGVSDTKGSILTYRVMKPMDLLIPDVKDGSHTIKFALGQLWDDPAATNQGDWANLDFVADDGQPRQIIATAIAD
jgi:hypothetical protein